MFYHGTTQENIRSIRAKGLLKGSFVSPDYDVAEWFAVERSNWNGHTAIVLETRGPASEVTLDRHGRREARLLENVVI